MGSVRAKSLEQEPEQATYAPITGHNEIRRSFSLVVRTTGRPETIADVVRREIWSIDSNLAVANIRTLEEILANATARTRFVLPLLALAVAASVSLSLGAVALTRLLQHSSSKSVLSTR